MATTYIDYKNDKGFGIFEPEMELVFFYVLKAFKKLDLEFEEKRNLLWHLETTIVGGFQGMLTLPWNRYLQSEEEELKMISILEQAITDLELKSEYISLEELNESRVRMPEDYRPAWRKPLKTTEVIKVIEALILMLKGEWESKNYDMLMDLG